MGGRRRAGGKGGIGGHNFPHLVVAVEARDFVPAPWE